MKKKRAAALLTAVMLLTACRADPNRPKTRVSDMDDKVSTAFFDYTVTAAAAHDSYQGRRPQAGERIVEVELTIKNTSSYAMPMGRYDFQLHWGEGESPTATRWRSTARNSCRTNTTFPQVRR